MLGGYGFDGFAERGEALANQGILCQIGQPAGGADAQAAVRQLFYLLQLGQTTHTDYGIRPEQLETHVEDDVGAPGDHQASITGTTQLLETFLQGGWFQILVLRKQHGSSSPRGAAPSNLILL